MASPFSIFRKHQKVALAAITILAMFAFVFVSPFGKSNSGPRGSGKDAEVATWKFGAITKSDIDDRLYNRKGVNQLMYAAYIQSMRHGGYPEGGHPPKFSEDQNDILQAIILHKKAEQMGIVVGDDAVKDFIDNQVAQGKLSDAEMASLVDGVDVSRNRFSPAQLFDAIRFELEASYFRFLISHDVNAVVYGRPEQRAYGTPEQRYDYFSRLNRKATIQVLPVAVKDFVGQVPDPRQDELLAFFEKYKDDLSYPSSPEPGFKVPNRAKFQYFVADRQELIKQEKSKVTDAEIKEYYDKHKEAFRKPSEDEGTSTSEKSKKAEPSASQDSSGKPAEKTDKTDQPQDKSDKTETKANSGSAPKTPEPGKDAGKPETEKTAPAAEKTTSDKTPPEQAAPDKTAPQTPASDDKKDSDKKDTDKKDADKKDTEKKDLDKKSTLLIPPLRQRPREELLALADGDSPPAPAAPTAKETPPAPATTPLAPAAPATPPLAPAAPATPPPAPAAPATTTPAPAAPATTPAPNATPGKDTPAATPPKADEAPKIGAAGTEPAKPEPAKTEPAKTEPAPGLPTGNQFPDLGLKPTEGPKKIPIVEYESLDDEKVRDKIRTSIAEERVGQRIDEIFKKLSGKLSSYSTKRSSWRAKHEGTAPTPPDFAEMAKDNGLTLKVTDLISILQANDSTDFGKSMGVFKDADGNLREYSILQNAFTPNLADYKPLISYSEDPQASFLIWRTEYKDTYVPKFEDVKPEVLEAWKMIEARKLALAKAGEYKDQANKQHAELKELALQFPSAPQVSQIGPFTWMSSLSVARDPTQPFQVQLTRPSGVDMAGDDFMRTAFGLEPGMTGVAMNQPKTIAYVIQLIKFAEAEDLFRNEFLAHMATPFGDEALATANGELSDGYRAKMAAIQSEFDIKFVADAATPTSTSAPLTSDDSDD